MHIHVTYIHSSRDSSMRNSPISAARNALLGSPHSAHALLKDLDNDSMYGSPLGGRKPESILSGLDEESPYDSPRAGSAAVLPESPLGSPRGGRPAAMQDQGMLGSPRGGRPAAMQDQGMLGSPRGGRTAAIQDQGMLGSPRGERPSAVDEVFIPSSCFPPLVFSSSSSNCLTLYIVVNEAVPHAGLCITTSASHAVVPTCHTYTHMNTC
jgi:hypothetical protein